MSIKLNSTVLEAVSRLSTQQTKGILPDETTDFCLSIDCLCSGVWEWLV
jgi:hypothetical protein